jgi:glycerol uptake facilitator protein
MSLMTPTSVFWGELLGTCILILLGVGVNSNVLLSKSKGHASGWIVISCGWGFAVAMGVYVASWTSGAHINPAVTIALTSIGKSPTALMPFYFAGQILGGLIGAFLAWLSYYSQFAATIEPEAKLMCFATKPPIKRPFWNFITEFIATAVLMVGILAIFDQHNHVPVASGIGPYAVGILVLSIGLSLGGPTGYAINPVRDLAPRLIHSFVPMRNKGTSDWGYAWVPLFGPILGGVLGAFVYQKFIESLKLLLNA